MDGTIIVHSFMIMFKNNKHHWYDGWIYDLFIAPYQDKLYSTILDLVEPNSSILDVGCATGRLAKFAAGSCRSYVGIDPSEKNIIRARKSAYDGEFIHIDVQTFADSSMDKFDYSIITFVIHEVAAEMRMDIIESMKKVSREIIIGDYLIPRPAGRWKYSTEVIEFLAGPDHYSNFKNYEQHGGLEGIVKKNNLNAVREIKNKPYGTHVLLLE